ncbi:hypothetical protein Pfo_026900 [Paulownia fortunei]|nr:hypothetical protein Pfo_026900 [Paulownia fortunei]
MEFQFQNLDQLDSSSVEHLMERKQRNLCSSTLEKTWRASFRLLQCEEVHDTYILEMHEVDTGNVTIHQLIAREKEIQMKVLHSDQRISLSPSVHIVNPLHTQQRSNLSLRERLAKWTIEQRKHKNSERRDKDIEEKEK